MVKPAQKLTFADMVYYLKEIGTATPYLPERLELISEMPRTASGKLQKFKLRELAAQFVKPNADSSRLNNGRPIY